MTAITREWLCWDDYSDKSERVGTFQRKHSRKCGVLQDLLMMSTTAVSEYSVCGTPVGSKVQKDGPNCPEAYQTIWSGDVFLQTLTSTTTAD